MAAETEEGKKIKTKNNGEAKSTGMNFLNIKHFSPWILFNILKTNPRLTKNTYHIYVRAGQSIARVSLFPGVFDLITTAGNRLDEFLLARAIYLFAQRHYMGFDSIGKRIDGHVPDMLHEH